MKALELDPNHFEAFEGLTRLDLATGRAKEAVARIDARLARKEPSPELLMVAAIAYAASGNPEKSETLLRQAIERDAGRLIAYSLLGQLYASQNRLNDARGQFEDILKRNPKSVAASTMIAMLHEAQGNTAAAEKQYQATLGIDARAAVAANNLAYIYVASNRNLDDALQLAQTAKQSLPDDPHVSDTIGWIYHKKDMHEQAIPHLENGVRLLPNDPVGHYHLGMAYVQSGDWVKARVALKRALSLKPDFQGADEARKALETIGA
jgi:tetratricopeptide (TPR) repeat protein